MNSNCAETLTETTCMNNDLLAQNIKYIRKILRFSQEELGQAIGVAKTTVWTWENKKNEPEKESLFSLSNLIGLKNPFDFYTVDLSTVRLKIQDKIVMIQPREKNKE